MSHRIVCYPMTTVIEEIWFSLLEKIVRNIPTGVFTFRFASHAPKVTFVEMFYFPLILG